jgi:hypothetical protein
MCRKRSTPNRRLSKQFSAVSRVRILLALFVQDWLHNSDTSNFNIGIGALGVHTTDVAGQMSHDWVTDLNDLMDPFRGPLNETIGHST